MSETWEYGDVARPEGFPWPPPEDGAILAALGQTWKSATFDPGEFFRRTPRDHGTGAALVYYLVLGVLLAGATLFWRTLSLYSGGAGTDTMATELGFGTINPVVGFLLSPAVLLVSLAVSAGVVHVLLLLFGGARHGFGTTVRVFCYAYSPALFGFVPVLGTVVGIVWMVVLLVVGLREAHQADGWKPALAVLLPFFLLLGFLAVVTLIAAAGALLGGA